MNNSVKYVILFSLFIFLFSFAAQAATTVPDALKPWVPWVLKDHKVLKCPFFNNFDYKAAKNHVCAWPGALTLDAKNSGSTFSQSWQVLEDSWLPLPGDSHHWPQQVQVNNKPAEVISRKGQPTLFLTPGHYQITGQFNWQTLPESLNIPKSFALVSLQVNGEAVALPKLVKGELWFGKQQLRQTKQDSVTVYVKRKVADGPFIHLQTSINLKVSGKQREAKIGKVLPPGFELIGLDGDLSSFLDAEGILHAKLKPGDWQISVQAYAAPTQLSWQRPEQLFLWPQEEVWAFDAWEGYRAGKLSGAKVIDASLADLPVDWSDLPTYVMQTDNQLNYAITHRGKPSQLENRLYLSRELWLSFDHSHYAFKDNISGSMVNDWRFSMPAPYLLNSGEDQEGSVLVTSQKDNERGVENRYPRVNFKARGTVENTSTLPVSGWNNHFESVSVTLNLPPANRLFAVFGADSVSQSWLSYWSIWTSFIVLFSAFLAGRTINPMVGLLTGLSLIFIFQEKDAPLMAICNALAIIAIAKYQPFDRLKPVVRAYLAFSLFGVIAAVLYFCTGQIRSTIHPQLEQRLTSGVPMGSSQFDQFRTNNTGEPARMESLPQIESIKMRKRSLSTSQGISASEQSNFIKERYQSDALTQAGAGIPNWRWHSYQIDWSSPVAKGQQAQIMVLSKTQTALFKSFGVILLLLWLYATLKSTFGALVKMIQLQSVSTIILLGLLTPFGVEQVQAQSMPSQHLLDALEQRMTEPPQCAPICATINNLHVSIDGNQLVLNMQVHALNPTAIALPFSAFWQAQRLKIDGKPQTQFHKRNGWTYFHLDKGLYKVNVTGTVAPVDVFQLQFAEQPKQVTFDDSTAWDIVGTQQNRLISNTLEFVATAQKQQSDNLQSSRYAVNPFVRITRKLSFDQTWTVQTIVSRIAPANGSISVKVPLLTGEHITSSDKVVKNGRVDVTIAAGKQDVSWKSTLDRQAQLTITADNKNSAIESWQITSSPSWHITQSGPPMIITEPQNLTQFTANYRPYDGESLVLNISRPEAVKGHILAIDKVNLTLDQGVRNSQINLQFDYRSTQGGEHTIELPEGFQLNDVLSDGKTLNLQPDNNRLTLPVSPGQHTVLVELRDNTQETTLLSSPSFNLNAPISNITTQINLSEQRWVLWTQGPALGPAVVYWGELTVFILLALVLSRYQFSPLGTISWLALGFGLSLNNWAALIMVAVWFASLTLSKHRPKDISRSNFNLSQLLLMGLSVATLFTLISAIPMSLLGHPDMGIVGNNSYGNQLRWFADKSDGLLPLISVFSLPILVYKGLMLAWVLWLSFSLLGWIKWAWQIWGEQGYWRTKPVHTDKAKDEPEPEQSESTQAVDADFPCADDDELKSNDKETKNEKDK